MYYVYGRKLRDLNTFTEVQWGCIGIRLKDFCIRGLLVHGRLLTGFVKSLQQSKMSTDANYLAPETNWLNIDEVTRESIESEYKRGESLISSDFINPTFR